MDTKNYEEIDKKNLKQGSIHFVMFFLLIATGIVVKRVYGHPEFMMLFHGPAAVFLIVSGLKISEKHRRHFSKIKID